MPRTNWKVALGSLVALWGLSASPSFARADEVLTMNEGATLRARPGERAPAITRLASGQRVHVIERQGRWIKVSAGGRSGWITRTQAGGGEAPVVEIAAAEPTEAPVSDEVKKEKRHQPKREPAVKKVKKEEAAVTQANDDEQPLAKTATASADRRGKWGAKDKNAVGADMVSGPERATRKPLTGSVTATPAPTAAPAPRLVASAAPARVSVGSTVTIGRATSVRARPSGRAEELYEAAAGEKMKVLVAGEDGKWVRVLDDSGTKGWVELASFEGAPPSPRRPPAGETPAGPPPAADDGPAAETSVAAEVEPASGSRHLVWAIDGDVGFMSRGESFTSPGSGIRANYDLSRTAPMLQVGAAAALRWSKLELGGELGYWRTVGGNTISVPDPSSGMTTAVGWGAQALDVRVGPGYWFMGGKLLVAGRAGFHWVSTDVDASAVAMLPSESVTGFTAGALVQMPHVTSKLGVQLSADMLLAGSLSQTDGMADGDSSDVAAYLVRAGATWRLGRSLQASGAYALSVQGIGFSGRDQREPTASGGQRKDVQHLINVGLRYQF